MNTEIFLDRIQNFFEVLHRVPTWRYSIAMMLLGKDVNKALKKISKNET